MERRSRSPTTNRDVFIGSRLYLPLIRRQRLVQGVTMQAGVSRGMRRGLRSFMAALTRRDG